MKTLRSKREAKTVQAGSLNKAISVLESVTVSLSADRERFQRELVKIQSEWKGFLIRNSDILNNPTLKAEINLLEQETTSLIKNLIFALDL